MRPSHSALGYGVLVLAALVSLALHGVLRRRGEVASSTWIGRWASKDVDGAGCTGHVLWQPQVVALEVRARQRISGWVVDTRGKPVPYVAVSALGPGGRMVQEATADACGGFTFEAEGRKHEATHVICNDEAAGLFGQQSIRATDAGDVDCVEVVICPRISLTLEVVGPPSARSRPYVVSCVEGDVVVAGGVEVTHRSRMTLAVPIAPFLTLMASSRDGAWRCVQECDTTSPLLGMQRLVLRGPWRRVSFSLPDTWKPAADLPVATVIRRGAREAVPVEVIDGRIAFWLPPAGRSETDILLVEHHELRGRAEVRRSPGDAAEVGTQVQELEAYSRIAIEVRGPDARVASALEVVDALGASCRTDRNGRCDAWQSVRGALRMTSGGVALRATGELARDGAIVMDLPVVSTLAVLVDGLDCDPYGSTRIVATWNRGRDRATLPAPSAGIVTMSLPVPAGTPVEVSAEVRGHVLAVSREAHAGDRGVVLRREGVCVQVHPIDGENVRLHGDVQLRDRIGGRVVGYTAVQVTPQHPVAAWFGVLPGEYEARFRGIGGEWRSLPRGLVVRELDVHVVADFRGL